jgi:hypothetical protein
VGKWRRRRMKIFSFLDLIHFASLWHVLFHIFFQGSKNSDLIFNIMVDNVI